ncbi:hypothetical protein PTKIN_Ptkin07bG0036800 [Pterospermum kingtungense]
MLLLCQLLTREKAEMARRYCYNDVLPFTAMVAMEFGNVGVYTLFKAATSEGMSYYILVAYSYAIATLVLFPLTFIFSSRAVLPPLKFHIISKICLLGLIGFSAQICQYKGIDYSSPTLASAVGNLQPAFTFILAVIFSMERVALRSSTTQAKIIGTIVSISGALVVVLYKGPQVFSSSPWTSSSVLLQRPLELSSEANWVIGGALLAVAHLCYSLLYIIQGVFSSICSPVHIWGLHLKGPVYVVIFKPLSIAIAAFMGAIFLGDALHLGSVIGAIILSIGFYAVIWGKAKEERIEDDSGLSSLSNVKFPLLQSHKVEDI